MTGAVAATGIPAGWEGILDPGETILWQGRPDGRLVLRAGSILTLLFGLGFAGFALFWMILAAGAGGGFWMFGLIHFAVGVGMAAGAVWWPAWRRRHTWYTLSNARAFIATDLPLRGRRLDSYPIDASSVLRLEQGPPDSVWFAHEYKRTKNGSRKVDIGFERIGDGAEVYRMMRDVQRSAR